MNRDQDWARKMVNKQLSRSSYNEMLWPNSVVKLLRRAQARERAAWRKAMKELTKENDAFWGDEKGDAAIGYTKALADLLAAMKRRRG